MKIAMIGTGYVGLVSGACFSEFGVDVTCVDRDHTKIDQLKAGIMPIFEPGLEDLVARNVAAGRLHFGTELEKAVRPADAVFIAVGTPSRRGDGHADLTYVYEAAREIAPFLRAGAVVVTKSTVPVGTGRAVEKIIRDVRPDAEFHQVSNPEFLREGSAIEDFMRPDRVVIGCHSEQAKQVMQALYRPLYLLETPMVFTSIETSELIKYAANGFLATKISFINEMADLCEALGCDVQDVARGMGLDGRIGRKFLHAGPGFGGSCFPKDTLALAQTARDVQKPLGLIEHVIDFNDRRKKSMAARILAALTASGGGAKGKTVAILGLTFKPNTDDMRDSPSLDIIPLLQQAGVKIRVFDPEGMKEAQKFFENLVWAKDEYECVDTADAVVILTEWNRFRALDLTRLKSLLTQPLMIDLRNVYAPDMMRREGFVYYSIGRPEVKP